MIIEYDIEKDFLYKKGLVAGEAKGEARGRQEERKEGKLLLARAMKENGEPIEKIMLYTSLSKADIDKL